MLNLELKYILRGKRLICGIDEAGRGPLAGPVAVAAVIMPLDVRIEGVDDSKKLTEKKRELLYNEIINSAIAVSSVMIEKDVIDEINILEATKLGMLKALKALSVTPDIALVDAVKLTTDIETEAIIHGDELSYNIAAASIVAKVERDRLMKEYAMKYPEYGFEEHKGYCTRSHVEALKKFGACPIHRKTFIKKFV
ncbi:MAG: ribonuclease HII [Christensenellales bacterium]|jgi:ribonuclease HII